MLCWTDSFILSSNDDQKTNEDLQHSLSDSSRTLVQTSDDRTQSAVYLSDHVRVDTSNQLDTNEDCNQSYSACDIEVHATRSQHKYVCKFCDQSYVSASKFKSHMRIHVGERAFICNVCNKKFTQSCHLARHKRIHTGECPFCCEVCGKKFARLTCLKKHMHIHTGERPFSCEVCDKKFTRSYELIRHVHSYKRKSF